MDNAEKRIEIEKYREMYLLAKELYNDEISSFDHLEEKTGKHLYALSIPLGTLLIIARWIIKQYSGFAVNYEIVVFVLYFLTVLFFTLGWIISFITLKPEKMVSIELNQKYRSSFKTYSAIEIYQSLTKNYEKAYNRIREVNNRKSKYVRKSYRCTIIAFSLLIFTIISIAIYFV